MAPLPFKSVTLRYARQLRSPAPAAVASVWQCASAPLMPPKFAPLPLPVLVTKKVMRVAVCAAGVCAGAETLSISSAGTRSSFFTAPMLSTNEGRCKLGLAGCPGRVYDLSEPSGHATQGSQLSGGCVGTVPNITPE